MEDKQYKELTDFIGGQFNKVYSEFDKVYSEFDRVWIEFDKVHTNFADLKNDFRQLQSAVDDYAHKADTYFMELAALGNKIDRLEKWISFIAEKTGITLPR